jgi:hypothetical protein
MLRRPASHVDEGIVRPTLKSMEHPSPHLHQSASGSHDPGAIFFIVAPAYNAAGIVMPYQTVKTLTPFEAGYLAGLIDGEGTITLSRRNLNKQRALVITINSTELCILKYVQEITGVGKITNKRITKANHTPSFTYQVANRQALEILKQTAVHLRSYKVDRARLVLKEYLRVTPRNGRYSPTQIQDREIFIENFLGIRPGQKQ